MDYSDFCSWLINEKKMSMRSAKDVVSRCKRVCAICQKAEITDITLSDLENAQAYSEKSMFIKSQLKRAITLSAEFGGK